MGILAQGNYKFLVACIAILAIGGAVIPLSMCICSIKNKMEAAADI